jgi:hypothetical protein
VAFSGVDFHAEIRHDRADRIFRAASFSIWEFSVISYGMAVSRAIGLIQ